MRVFLKIFIAVYFLWPAIAAASISDCAFVTPKPVSLLAEIFYIGRPIWFASAVAAVVLILLYKFLRLQKISQKYSIIYLLIAPVMYLLARWEMKQLKNYYDFEVTLGCYSYYTVDKRIIYGGVLALLYLLAACLFFVGTKLEGKKFEIYQNCIFAVGILFFLIGIGNYDRHFILPFHFAK